MEDSTDEKENKDNLEHDLEDELDSSKLNQNEKTHEDETNDRLETKLQEAYGKQDDLQNKYLIHSNS